MARCSWLSVAACLLVVRVACQGELEGVLSSHQCFEEHEKFPDQRLCVFENLLVHNNTLIYLSRDATRLPEIVISWEKKYDGDQLLHPVVLAPEQLPAGIGQVKIVKEAGLFHQQHAENFYHLFTEIAPTVHYVVCRWLGRCLYQKHDHLRIYWVHEKRAGLSLSWDYKMPTGIAELFGCITPYPVQNIYDVTVEEGQTLLLKKAVVGLPRNVRFYHQKKQEWKRRWRDPPPLEYMQSYRQRVADCLGFDFVDAVAPTSPVRITFVNRHYEDGRHILNAGRLRDKIAALPAVKALGDVEVNVVYLQGTLREQAQIIWNTSIYIWGHGAAMAQTFFLPRGAQALEVVQWVVDDPTDQHIWVQGIRRAFDLQIGLDTVVNNDRSKVFFNLDRILAPNSQYFKFNDTEKALLIEKLKCPTWHADERGISGGECFGWFHWGMSLVLDFELLRPKLEAALTNLTQAVAALGGGTSGRGRRPAGAGFFSMLGQGPGAAPGGRLIARWREAAEGPSGAAGQRAGEASSSAVGSEVAGGGAGQVAEAGRGQPEGERPEGAGAAAAT